MQQKDLLNQYNYAEFKPETFTPWMNFASSPPVGEVAPDFPLWQLEDKNEIQLSEIWSAHVLTVVEFGSFT